jgi:acetyl esterase/lipase
VFSPQTGNSWPVVVLLRGGPGVPGARRGYEALATRLAAAGLVVFNADYRDMPEYGARYPRAFDDAACAVRMARATASRYRGTGRSVTMVGHSLGAYVGSLVALSANAYASVCLARGNGAPDTFVGISGPYLLNQANLQGNFASVLGGTRAQIPSVWKSADPLAWVGRRPGVRFRIVHGSDDPTVDVAASEALQTALARAGFDTSLTTVSGGTHVSVLAGGKTGEWTLAVILAAVR